MIDQIRYVPNIGFDYIVASDPTNTVNPTRVGVTWLNVTTGILFICIDNSTNANIWKSTAANVFRGALVYKSTTQNVTTGGAETVVTWDLEIYDTNGFHNTAVNNHLFTIPNIGISRVRIGFSCEFGTSTAGRRYQRIYKNGAAFIGGSMAYYAPGNQTAMTIHSAVVSATAGDTFEAHAWQDSGGTLAIGGMSTWFSIEVIE